MDRFDNVAFAQRQRLHFIESLALWDGTVQRQRVCDSFGVAPAQVTRDIGTYLEQCPDNLVYNNRLKVYLPSSDFKPVLATGDPSEYLSLLKSGIRPRTVELLPGLHTGQAPHAALPSPRAPVASQVLRQVLFAIQRRIGLDINYLSMDAEGASSRTIWPHALFFSGEWWYMRAFDSKRQAFRDFALHRIEEANRAKDASPVVPDRDAHWIDTVEVIVVPDSRLTDVQQAIVARDFGMEKDRLGWAWKESLKQCMVGYFVAQYWLDVNLNRPRRTRLALRNRDQLERYFFRSSPTVEE